VPKAGYRQRSVGLGRTKHEHVLIAEAAIGHLLPKGVEVHHVDGNGLNNHPTNLVICPDKAYHKLLHVRARVIAAGGDPNTQRICSHCKAVLAVAEFYRASTPGGLQKQCKACCKLSDRGRWRRGPKDRAA
jgi:hypothetical protein